MKTILVVFDTLRYDHTSFNGYAKETTPVMKHLSEKGATFDNCYATNVPTQPSFTSLLTGQRGIKTKIVTHGQPEELISNNFENLPRILAKNGITTAAVSSLYRFRRWFAEGFEYYLDPNLNKWLQHVSCEDVNNKAIPWIQEHNKDDFFLFLHYWDAHSPYNLVPEKYVKKFYSGNPFDPSNKSLERLKKDKIKYFFASNIVIPELKNGLTDIEYPKSQYDAEINYADEYFGHILEVLEKEKILNETLIIVTADHGEAFGEHNVYFDHWSAYEEIAHIPLIFFYPHNIKKQRITTFIQNIDIAPTILDFFGIKAEDTLDGKSFMDILQGKSRDHRNFVVTDQALWCAQRSYRTEEWTLVRTYSPGLLGEIPKWELFNRKNDPLELNNLLGSNKRIFTDLREEFLSWLDEELNGHIDPVRLEAEKNAMVKSVKVKYEKWLMNQKKEDLTPEDRGFLDMGSFSSPLEVE